MQSYDDSFYTDNNGKELHSFAHFLKELAEEQNLPLLLPNAFLWDLYRTKSYAKNVSGRRFINGMHRMLQNSPSLMPGYKSCTNGVHAVTRGGLNRLEGITQLALKHDLRDWAGLEQKVDKSTSYNGLICRTTPKKGD